jgi:hypothetical protein
MDGSKSRFKALLSAVQKEENGFGERIVLGDYFAQLKIKYFCLIWNGKSTSCPIQ